MNYRLRAPALEDGHRMHRLVRDCPPLDLNAPYAYLLLCQHHAATCVVAEHPERLAGMVSAYTPPRQPDTLFVWQVAVNPCDRGQGLAHLMLEHLLRRTHSTDVRFIETTITPDNQASIALFQGLARVLDTHCTHSPLFEARHFGAQAHAPEHLFRIGPFTTTSTSHITDIAPTAYPSAARGA